MTADGSSSINYTVDGTVPTCSTGTVYSSANPISVSSSETISAISCYPDNNFSSVSIFNYTITPASSGGGGTTTSSGGGGGGGYIAPATFNAGDINHDGTVDELDFSIMMSQWGQTGCSTTNSWCSGADLNKDGAVDELDFSILMANWGL